jgi:hypothetical protein
MLPRDGAVIGIDLADEKQAIAVVDHDVRVLARKTVRVKAFRLGEALDWAVGQARAKGFASVAVACEPTGPRWLQVQRLCAERGLPMGGPAAPGPPACRADHLGHRVGAAGPGLLVGGLAGGDRGVRAAVFVEDVAGGPAGSDLAVRRPAGGTG